MFTFTDLQTAGLILACKHRLCRITGKPLYNADFIQWAKDVFSYFAKNAWQFSKTLKKTLKQSWKYILSSAKALDAIQEAKRKAKAIDKAKQQTAQAKPSFSFRSNVPPIVAKYNQTGRQLQKGKDARETFTDIPVIRVHKSKYYDR